jgi:F-type H+-transporting ATPase subunit b
MPQLNPEFFATQVFWLVVTFAALYLLMSTIALPRIGMVLDERQRRIDENLTKAAALKAEADAAVKAYEKALADAKAQAATMLKQTTERLGKEAEERNRDLGHRLAEQIKAGEGRIAEAKAQAMASVREVAIDVATSTITRLIGGQVNAAELDGAIAEALKGTVR